MFFSSKSNMAPYVWFSYSTESDNVGCSLRVSSDPWLVDSPSCFDEERELVSSTSEEMLFIGNVPYKNVIHRRNIIGSVTYRYIIGNVI